MAPVCSTCTLVCTLVHTGRRESLSTPRPHPMPTGPVDLTHSSPPAEYRHKGYAYTCSHMHTHMHAHSHTHIHNLSVCLSRLVSQAARTQNLLSPCWLHLEASAGLGMGPHAGEGLLLCSSEAPPPASGFRRHHPRWGYTLAPPSGCREEPFGGQGSRTSGPKLPCCGRAAADPDAPTGHTGGSPKSDPPWGDQSNSLNCQLPP